MMVVSLDAAYFTLLAIQMKRKLEALAYPLDESLRILRDEIFYSVIRLKESQANSTEEPMPRDFLPQMHTSTENIKEKLSPLLEWANAFEEINYSPSKDELTTAIDSSKLVIEEIYVIHAGISALKLTPASLEYMKNLREQVNELVYRAVKLDEFIKEQAYHMASFD